MVPSNATVALVSFGCRTNQEEISALSRDLIAQGYAIVDNVEDAAIVVVNTCSVTAHAETKTRRFIRSLARKAPDAKILLTGCLVEQYPDSIKQQLGARWVVGNAYKHAIADIIAGNRETVVFGALTKDREVAIGQSAIGAFDWHDRTRFSVKIQEGCDNGCAYCIVPRLRGPSRSASLDAVVAACRQAIEAGMKEIVLTGTHIGQYRDKHSGESIVELAKTIRACAGPDFRLRLSSLNPADVSENLCNLLVEDERICNHLHISFQSLCPEIVVSMGRSVEDMLQCVARIEKIRKARPLTALGGDFIVGFPGETDAMFEETVEKVQQLGFAYGHVFRYSQRPHTKAAAMGNQVSEQVKRYRSDRLRSVLKGARRRFIGRQLHAVHTVLVETHLPVTGLTSNYIRFEVAEIYAEPNTWVKVKIRSYNEQANRCLGTVV